jgi:acyl-CoA synthetase (NDP forming)
MTSHTGSLASDDRVFDGMCRQAGVTRAPSVEAAFEAAATFATPPQPRGDRGVVLTTVGGWGVVTADAITRSSLRLAELPEDLFASIDGLLPPRWSRNNPVDLAGGETRDTIPQIVDIVAGRHAFGQDYVAYDSVGTVGTYAARPLKPASYFEACLEGSSVDGYARCLQTALEPCP